MNTDNTSISGETIDYGPCAFMDTYDPSTVFSSIDTGGRYAYENQPQIAVWNLARFAETLLTLLHVDVEDAVKIAEKEIMTFWNIYHTERLYGMRKKLGLFSQDTEDEVLIHELLQLMHHFKADYTHTFCALTLDKLEEMPLFTSAEFARWYERWQARLGRQSRSQSEIKNANEK